MARNKVFYHTGAPCNGCGGIGDHWRTLDAAGVNFGVYSVEGAGLIVEASQFQHADPLIYRTLATDVAEYTLPPNEAAAHTWAVLMERVPPEVHALKDRCFIEIGNEQNKEVADWLGWYYVELANLAAANGYKICGPAWSTGEPEPYHWETPGWLAYLKLCAQHPERLAITTHEYSLSADDLMDGYPWLVGRVGFLFDVCDKHGIARPTTFITELGWVHNDLPPFDIAKEDIERVAEEYAQYPAIKAAFLWTLMGGGDKKTLGAELNALMHWLADYAIATDFPDAPIPPPDDPPPPTEPPPPVMSNLLLNPSFEQGWKDSETYSTTQNPLGWTVEWNIGAGFGNPYSEYPYLLGECVHKSKAMLPQNEQDVFIWDGEWCLKLFAGQRAFWARLKQTLDLPAGDYELSTPVWVDAYRGMVGGVKDYSMEPTHAQMMVKANGQIVHDWESMKSGHRITALADTNFHHGGGPLTLAVHFRMNWPGNNNFFLDGWSLEPVTVAPPPPPPPPDTGYIATVVKLPQGATIDEWEQAADYAWGFQHTITASDDDMLAVLDAGNPESYVKLAWPEKQPETGALITEAGYSWEPLFVVAPKPPVEPPVVDERPIIDVSHHQGKIKWDVFAPKVAAVIIRLGYGVTEDREARRNVQEAELRGVPYAVYHYFVPTVDAVAQANFFGNLAKAIAPGRLCCVDLEEKAGVDSATPTRVKAYIDALETIVDHQAMIYTNIDYWANVVKSPAWAVFQPLWIAAWTDASKPIVPKPFVDWDVWQYAVKEISQSEWGVFSERLDFNRLNPAAGYVADFLDSSWWFPAEEVDVLPYIKGDHKRQFDMGHNVNGGGTQTVQVWHHTAANWLYIKGEAGEYERLGLLNWKDTPYIHRFEDLSEGPDRFYAHYMSNGGSIGAPWFPRFAEVGRWYETSKFVQHYQKGTCAKLNGGGANDKLRILHGPRSVTYPESGATLPDVITIEWAGGEQYDFAAGRGCVAFRDADRRFWFIGDLEGREDRKYDKPGCIPLGW